MPLFRNMANRIPFVSSITQRVMAISLRTKMLILSGMVFLGFSVIVMLGSQLLRDVRIGGAGYVAIRNGQEALERIAYLKSDFNQIRVEYLSLVEETIPEIRKQRLEAIGGLNARVDRSFADIMTFLPEEQQKQLTSARDEWQVFTDNMSGKIMPVILEGDRELALERLQTIQKHRYERFVANLDVLIAMLNKRSEQTEQAIETMVAQRMLTMAVSGLLICSIVLALALVVSYLFVRPLRRATEFTRRISDGDLSGSLQVATRDEVGVLADNLNQMVRGLGILVSQIGEAARELSKVSKTVSSSSERVSSETEFQVKSIDYISSAMEKITTSTGAILGEVTSLSGANADTQASVAAMADATSEVVQHAELLKQLAATVTTSVAAISDSVKTLDTSLDSLGTKAGDTASSVSLLAESVTAVRHKAVLTFELAGQAYAEAILGKEAVHAAMSGMEKIRRSSRETGEVVGELSASAEDISAVLAVIDDITAQTALLSLNARIIATQSGGAGKAFSVVAEEFKSLSRRTAGSTVEISAKIERVREQILRAVKAITATETVVSEGEKLSRISGEALDKIVATALQTSNQMEAIVQATTLQSDESGVIKNAIHSVNETIGAVAAASRNLKQESAQISGAMERLNLMALQVVDAIVENNRAAEHITTAGAAVSAMIERIRTSCEAEAVESNHILCAVEEVRSAMHNNLLAAQSGQRAGAELLRHVAQLLEAVNVFKQHSSQQQPEPSVMQAPLPQVVLTPLLRAHNLSG